MMYTAEQMRQACRDGFDAGAACEREIACALALQRASLPTPQDLRDYALDANQHGNRWVPISPQSLSALAGELERLRDLLAMRRDQGNAQATAGTQQPPAWATTGRTTMTTDTNSQPMNVTLERMAQAFEAWENGFRAEPSKYLTAEECAAANVSELSADRAAYFRELLAVAAA